MIQSDPSEAIAVDTLPLKKVRLINNRLYRNNEVFLMLLRGMEENEKDILRNFLYEAIFIPEGVKPPDKSIIEQPELRIYYEDFGTGGADYCIVVEKYGSKRLIGNKDNSVNREKHHEIDHCK